MVGQIFEIVHYIEQEQEPSDAKQDELEPSDPLPPATPPRPVQIEDNVEQPLAPGTPPRQVQIESDLEEIIFEAAPDFGFIESNDEIMQFCVHMNIRGHSARELCDSEIMYLVDLLSHTRESLIDECGFSASFARMVFNRIQLYKREADDKEAVGNGRIDIHIEEGACVVAGNGGIDIEVEEKKFEGDEKDEQIEGNDRGGAFRMVLYKEKNRLIFTFAPTVLKIDWFKIFIVKLILTKGLLDTLMMITHLIDNNTKGGEAAEIRYHMVEQEGGSMEWPMAPIYVSRSAMLRFEQGGFCSFEGYKWFNKWKGGRPHLEGRVIWGKLSDSYNQFDPEHRAQQDRIIGREFRGAEEEIRQYIISTGDQAGCSQLGWYGNRNVNLNYDLGLGDLVDNDMNNDNDNDN